MFRKFSILNSQLSTQYGQTLLELIVSVGIIVTVLSAITMLTVRSLDSSEFSRAENRSTQYASQGVELLRNYRNTNWAQFNSTLTTGEYCLGENVTTPTANPDPSKDGCNGATNISGIPPFARRVKIDNPSPDCAIGGGVPNQTKVTVTVSWADGKCTDPANNLYCHDSVVASCLAGPVPTATPVPTSTPVPTPTPTPLPFKYVFITSTDCKGNTDYGGGVICSDSGNTGLSGADSFCNARAIVAGIGSTAGRGSYMAWLSDSTGSPYTRMNHSAIPYKLVDRTTVVANDWAGLTSGTLLAPINMTESGGTKNANPWTNTTPEGTTSGTNSCSNWASTGGNGLVGSSSYANFFWTSAFNASCDTTRPFYCIEQ